jgi:hypothetical protein
MGMIVHKETQRRSELDDMLTAELRERAKAEDRKDDELVADADFTRNLKKTSSFSWVWFVLIGLALISLILIVTI